jgi:X-linked retinitis pigmentosa GTPase regulator
MLFASGLNTFGQLGTGANKSVTRFVRAMTDVMFTRVRCGHHSAGLSVGHELYLWGTGAFGELLTPTKCLDVKIRRIEMGDTYGLA